jgi:hypothetical protein
MENDFYSMKHLPELRELDKWIADNVTKWTPLPPPFDCDMQGNKFPGSDEVPHYTTRPADAMEVLEQCYEYAESFESGKDDSQGWWFFKDTDQPINANSHESLPLAICLFSKQLFTS